MDIEKSKYMGGDEKTTHKVKGLDFALLRKKREELFEMKKENLEEEDDDDDEEEDNTFSSSRVSSVFLFRDHFRVWRRTTIKTTTTTTETRITER